MWEGGGVILVPGEPVELLSVEVQLAQLGHCLEPQPLVLNSRHS